MTNKVLVRNIVVASALTSVSLVANGQTQVRVTDYTEASSAYTEAYVNGSLNAGRLRSEAQTGYDLNLALDYDKVNSTPDRDVRYQINGFGSISRGTTAGASSANSYGIGAGITMDNYFTPGSSGGFWYGGLNLQAQDAFDNRQITGIVGLGYGRVRNVTPMAKAIRVMEELGARGKLNGTPGLPIYQQVAGIIDKEDEYRAKHGFKDWAEFWVNDIAESLKQSGSTSPEFGAGDVLKLYNILVNERISARKTGWKVRAGVGYVFRNFNGTSGSDPAVELGAEYHHPLSNRTQFSTEAVVNTILGDESSFTLQNVMTLTHEIDDRIDWENSWTLNYAKDGASGTAVRTNILRTAFFYSLSNQLDLSATYSLTNVSGDTTAANPKGTDRALFVGLRYRLK